MFQKISHIPITKEQFHRIHTQIMIFILLLFCGSQAIGNNTAQSILESLKEKKEPESFLNSTPAQKESVGNIIRNKMRLCWNPAVGVENGLTNVTILGLKFDIDGRLVESVNLSPNSGFGSQKAFEVARRAVIRCSPFEGLDPNSYEVWKEINLIFNPKKMMR